MIASSFLLLSSKCKRKKNTIVASSVSIKTEIEITGNECFPTFDEYIDIEIYSINEDGVPEINEQYTKFGYIGSISKTGNKLIIQDFDVPASGNFKIIVRIEELVCREQPCCINCMNISPSNRGRPIWNAYSPTISGKQSRFKLEAIKSSCRCCD